MAGEPGVDLRDPAVLTSLFVPALIGFYLLLTSTTSLIPGIWPYDAKRILQFGVLIILFLAPALNGRINREFGELLSAIPGWLKTTLLVIVFWGVVSVLVNAQSLMHALNSFSEVALLTSLTLGIFVVAACRRIAGRWFDRIAIALIALTGLAVGLQELIGVVAAQNAGVDFNFRVSLLHFSWPRFYNQVQSWAVPVLAALPLLFARYRLAAVLCFIVLGLQWYIILMTGARGSFVAIGTAIVFALIFLPPVRSRLLKWQTAGIALGALIFALVMFSFEAGDISSTTEPGSESIRHSTGREADRNASGGQLTGGENSFFKQSLGRPMVHTSGRTWMWSVTIRDARNNPLLGIGPMNYVCTSPVPIGHPHNFPLQLAAEWGIPVALGICAIFGFLLWRTSQSIRHSEFDTPEDTVFAGLLLTGILAAALHACLSGVMVMPASQVTGLLICGMLLGLIPSTSKEKRVRALQRGHLAGLLLVVSILMLGIFELQTMKNRAKLLEPGATMWPRIWQDAKVCSLYNSQNEVKN